METIKMIALLLLSMAVARGAAAPWRKNLSYPPAQNQRHLHPRSDHQHQPKLRPGHREQVNITTADEDEEELEDKDSILRYHSDALTFTHGIASGDPEANSVILWTRLAPSADDSWTEIHLDGLAPVYDEDEEQGYSDSRKSACVEFEISPTDKFTDVVDSGRAYTSNLVDFTVKFEAQNLRSFTTYYYRFNICGSSRRSATGRTKTIPSENQDIPGSITMAVYSSATYQTGYFNPYGSPVHKNSVDYVLHLGNYIDEQTLNDHGVFRDMYLRHELYTLYDYRKRIATYRTDPQLQANHGHYAWIPLMNDHDVATYAWRDGSLVSKGDTFLRRRQAAFRAWYEWMPVRQVDPDDDLRRWHRVKMGNLLDLVLLDTHFYGRDVTADEKTLEINGFKNVELHELVNEQNRTILGFEQEKWLTDTLLDSKRDNTTWRLIGQQGLFNRAKHRVRAWLSAHKNTTWYPETWEGYRASRDRLMAQVMDNHIGNVVFLSGGFHASTAWDLTWPDGHRDLPYEWMSGHGSLGAEFTVPSVTPEQDFKFITGLWRFYWNLFWSGTLLRANDNLQWHDRAGNGYMELEVSRERVLASFFDTGPPKKVSPAETLLAQFTVRDGEHKLARGTGQGEIGGRRCKRGVCKPPGLLDEWTDRWFQG